MFTVDVKQQIKSKSKTMPVISTNDMGMCTKISLFGCLNSHGCDQSLHILIQFYNTAPVRMDIHAVNGFILREFYVLYTFASICKSNSLQI